jgi:hypothetical protein
MTIIQQSSPMDTSSRSLKSSTHEVDNENSFESVLEAVVVEKAPRAASEREEEIHADNQSRLDLDIRIPHAELLKVFDEVSDENVSVERLQRFPVNLIQQPHIKDDSDALSDLSNVVGDLRRSRKTNEDGTELDVSMLIPLVAPEVKISKPDASDGSEVSIDETYRGNLENAVNINAQNFGNKTDVSSFALSSEKVTLPPAALDLTLGPNAESISSLIDKLPNAAVEISSKFDSMDVLSDEVPIISVDVSSKIPEVKLENNASMMGESAEDLNDSTALELESASSTEFNVDVKTVQTTTTTEVSGKSDNIKELSTVPAQQVHQAIMAGKEGILPTESKTLSIVLNPEELGIVNVELTSDASGKMSAVLSVEKQETLNLLQQDLHQLKSILKEIGIDDSSVSLQLSSNADQGQQQQSEYVSWDEREHMLARQQNSAVKTVTEKAMYIERPITRRLDIQA